MVNTSMMTQICIFYYRSLAAALQDEEEAASEGHSLATTFEAMAL